MSNRRVTLICRDARTPDRDWNLSRNATSRIVVTEQLSVVRYALGASATDMGVDIERVVIDGSGASDDFLHLLAELPHHFHGDIVFLREDGSGFLSASGRGDGRVLYSLQAADARFYLETAGVVTGRIAMTHFLESAMLASAAA